MTVERVVIVGAGQGGLQAAISLRQEGFEGSITLIGAEPGLPYQRPPLSKAYLKEGKAEELVLRPESFFESKDVRYMPSTFVEKINRENQTIATSQGSVPYDHLILATGTRNLRPPVLGLEHALDLRTLEDAQKLREKLVGKMKIAIIGGGFIGLEFASVARAAGHDVVVAEAADRLMGRAVSPEISQYYFDFHKNMGTEIRLGQPVQTVKENGMTLADGTFIPADLVLLAAGVRPNIELAEDAGLAIENGIVVDEYLQTSDPNISALGDVASFPCPQSGHRIRLESVQAATDHARNIAKRIAKNERNPYQAVAWFWSDQGDQKLQISGRADARDQSERLGDQMVLRFRDGYLSAVETINDAKSHMKSRKLLASGEPITRQQAIDALSNSG